MNKKVLAAVPILIAATLTACSFSPYDLSEVRAALDASPNLTGNYDTELFVNRAEFVCQDLMAEYQAQGTLSEEEERDIVFDGYDFAGTTYRPGREGIVQKSLETSAVTNVVVGEICPTYYGADWYR